jgi:hypothetical protein
MHLSQRVHAVKNANSFNAPGGRNIFGPMLSKADSSFSAAKPATKVPSDLKKLPRSWGWSSLEFIF